MKSREYAMSLVIAAFRQALKKKKTGVHSMTLAVLNNRLLQLTDRKFDPEEFGVRDLRAFLVELGPEIRLLDDGKDVCVELAENARHAIVPSDENG